MTATEELVKKIGQLIGQISTEGSLPGSVGCFFISSLPSMLIFYFLMQHSPIHIEMKRRSPGVLKCKTLRCGALTVGSDHDP